MAKTGLVNKKADDKKRKRLKRKRTGKMETNIITIIGIILVFLQGIVGFILSGIKKDQADIWGRMNSHYHEVSCDNAECRTLKTGNVIIPAKGG